jgi:hypothetical protein
VTSAVVSGSATGTSASLVCSNASASGAAAKVPDGIPSAIMTARDTESTLFPVPFILHSLSFHISSVTVKREAAVNLSVISFPKKTAVISFSKVRYNCRYTISCLRRKNIKMLFDLLEFCFLRKLITNFFSRFPGLQIIVLPNLLTYPLYAMVSYDNTPCLQ